MRVKTAISLAFRMAAARFPEVHQRWVDASFRIGGQLPNSILMVSIQRCGEIDMLLRAIEGEPNRKEALNPSDIEFMAFNYQCLLSEDWIASVYEITRLRKERGLVAADSPEVAIARSLHILRMPLDKHEIAKGPGLKHPLQMQRLPPSGEARDAYVYDHSDPSRSHIVPTGISARGSLMWQAIDGATLQETWFERQGIADSLLDVWAPIIPGADAAASSDGK